MKALSDSTPRPKKNRRSARVGYARGEDTRARVIASALELFGQHGFEGASTRDIAVQAGVNAPALQYYFSSKEGLYLACVDQMVTCMWACVSPAVAKAELLLTNRRAGNAGLIAAFCDIQEGMATFFCGTCHSADWLLIVTREHAGLGPDPGFHLMYEKFSAKLLAVSAALVGRLLGTRATAHETRIQAMALNGQLLTFLFLRRTLLTALGWDGFRGKRVVLVKRIVVENTEGLLRAMLSAKKRSGRLTAPADVSRRLRR